MEDICRDVTECIGNTPLIRINTITKNDGIECEILAKCEYFNPGGSIKDRIAKRMIEEAEHNNSLTHTPLTTIIEPTSGNTGIGLAMIGCAVKNYPTIIAIPEKMSSEKVSMIKLLGARVIHTPTEAVYESEESNFGVARRLNNEIPDSIVLDQFSNKYNPLAHYESTAAEIYQQTKGKLDAVVLGVGTGGTISGIGKFFKERIPSVRIIGVDPEGSILGDGLDCTVNLSTLRPYKVEGIGYDFIPRVLDSHYVDEWIKITDRDTFITARRLIREEGLLCGGSSGAAVFAALQVARLLGNGKRVVVILPDSVRNYMSKLVCDYWMVKNDFLDDFSPAAYSNAPFLGWNISTELWLSRCKNIPLVDSFDDLAECLRDNCPISQLSSNGRFCSQMCMMKAIQQNPFNLSSIGGVADPNDLTDAFLLQAPNVEEWDDSKRELLFAKKMAFLFEKYSLAIIKRTDWQTWNVNYVYLQRGDYLKYLVSLNHSSLKEK